MTAGAPVRPGRRLGALATAVSPARLGGLAVLLFLAVLNVVDPPLLDRVRAFGFDAEQRLVPRGDEGLPAPIVTIDEASLARYGQWPWPRTLIARLVERIAAGKPAVLGVDIVFPEPDRLSPSRLAGELPDLPPEAARALAGLPDSETALATAFRAVPTVLGLDATFDVEPVPRPLRTPLVRQAGDPLPFLPHFPDLLVSLPALTAAEAGTAALVATTDPDGTVRCMPMLVVGRGHLIPGLGLEMLRIASGGGALGIDTGSTGIRAVSVGGLRVPTDHQGRACIRFSPSYAGRYVSAAGLLDGSIDPARFAGRAVLLGVTGAGLLDLKQTPFGPTQGVELHAQLIESVLAGSLLHILPPAGSVGTLLVVLAGLVPIFALPHRRPVLAGGLLLLELGGLAGASLAALGLANWEVDALFPGLAALATFGTMQGAALRAAEATRRLLAAELIHEREVKARLEGELYVARAIQMGLLPHQFPGAPARPDIEMFALLEPARMVGGDLYDFLFLDMRRLFFTVADVSGKGVPAALFMAMSKEVLRAAAVQHGEALDLVFAEANAKIAQASSDMLTEGADMMFVTVFAGVLDTVTGMLVYASAGHDAPLLLHGGDQLVAIDSAGGPPLGTVDEFPYPLERRQLARGDLVFVFTDGVTEAENEAKALYGGARLQRMLVSAPTASTRGIVEFVREDLKRFVAGADQADDITMFSLRWLGPRRAVSGP